MKNRISWQINLVVIFLIIGVTLLLLTIGYLSGIKYPSVYTVVSIFGISLGIIFLAIAILTLRRYINRPRIPFPQPLYPPTLQNPPFLYPYPPEIVHYQQLTQMQIKYCSNCNKQIPIYSKFCLHGGVKQDKI